MSLCSDLVIAGFVTLSPGFLSFWPSKVFPDPHTDNTEENIFRDRLVFSLLCSPTGFIAKLQQEEALCVPFLSLLFCGISVFLSQNELCRSQSQCCNTALLCLTAITRDSLQ